MGKTLKLLVILAMLAVVPVRAIAAVTIGFCALGHQDALVQVQADHEHDASRHSGPAPEPRADGGPDCSVCAEHCTSASFVVPDTLAALSGIAGLDRILQGKRLGDSFVPEHFDRPPLAL